MSKTNVDRLAKTIGALETGFDEHAAHSDLLTVRDGVIQRFDS
jgi:hypothetical protein